MAFGVLFDFTGNSNVSKVITAAEMIQQSWFLSALNTSEPIDLFLLIGHNPVRPSSSTSTFKVGQIIYLSRPIHTNRLDRIQCNQGSQTKHSDSNLRRT